MRITRLSSLLCCPPNDAEAWLSIRPDEEATPERDAHIRDAFAAVHSLFRQRDGLTALFPHRAEMYRLQCSAAIWDIAVRLHEKLEITP